MVVHVLFPLCTRPVSVQVNRNIGVPVARREYGNDGFPVLAAYGNGYGNSRFLVLPWGAGGGGGNAAAR
jgi:hypothetical protein